MPPHIGKDRPPLRSKGAITVEWVPHRVSFRQGSEWVGNVHKLSNEFFGSRCGVAPDQPTPNGGRSPEVLGTTWRNTGPLGPAHVAEPRKTAGQTSRVSTLGLSSRTKELSDARESRQS